MTVAVLDPATLTHETLADLYLVRDMVTQERVDYLDAHLGEDRVIRDAPAGFMLLGVGTERSAFYDPETGLVYKRRNRMSPAETQEAARRERIALYTASLWLESICKPVRYADTHYHTAPSGVEYMVQEFIADVGMHRWHDALSDEVADLLEKTPCQVTGLSRDYTRDNAGTDPVTGVGVLTDLLEIYPSRY